MAILNRGWFCFKKVSWKKDRGDGSEYPWGYYHGNEFGLKEMPNWVTLPSENSFYKGFNRDIEMS
jgi:hypothetical protein